MLSYDLHHVAEDIGNVVVLILGGYQSLPRLVRGVNRHEGLQLNSSEH